eukprot:765065-Hanusia_phi.AAC.2
MLDLPRSRVSGNQEYSPALLAPNEVFPCSGVPGQRGGPATKSGDKGPVELSSVDSVTSCCSCGRRSGSLMTCKLEQQGGFLPDLLQHHQSCESLSPHPQV